MSAWPISLIATASDTPPASRSVAAPCRSPWRVISPNPCVAANLRQPVESDAESQGPRSRCRRRAPVAVRSRATSRLGQRGGAGVPSSRRPGARDPARRLPTLADRSGSRRLRRSASALHAGTVHVVPAERQHFLASEPEPGRQVDGDVPRNLSLDRLGDRHGFRSTDHLEHRPVPHRTIHELRPGGSSAGSPCGACTTTGKKRGRVHSLNKHGPVPA